MYFKTKLFLLLAKLLNLKLSKSDLDANPFQQFAKWFKAAKRIPFLAYPNAMTVATANKNAQPVGRVVLLKSYDEHGFVFFTNYNSAKGSDLMANPQVSLSFYWPVLERQVRILGKAEQVPSRESDEYFNSRPRGSQIGAWASSQSEVVADRKTLEAQYKIFEDKFKGQAVQRPPHWGGFRVVPESIEFWQGRLDRFHDRLRYVKSGNDWKIERLSP